MNRRLPPITGERYPRTYQEFLGWFTDDRHAADILLVATGRMDLNALNVASKPSNGQPPGATFIVGIAEARFL